MASTPTASAGHEVQVRGKVLEAEVKISVDPGMPLPLACALYAVETPQGYWLCAYYGSNRSVFDFLPQKGAEIDEGKLGITFHHKRLVPKDQYQPALWEEFKKQYFMSYGGHGA